jgi:hypothetical protein
MALELSSTAVRQPNSNLYQNHENIKQYPSSQIIYKPAYAQSNSSLSSSLGEKEHRAQNKQSNSSKDLNKIFNKLQTHYMYNFKQVR